MKMNRLLDDNHQSFGLTPATIDHIRSVNGWIKFFAIGGMILFGIGALIYLIGGLVIMTQIPIMGIVVLLMVAVFGMYVVTYIRLLQHANSLDRVVMEGSPQALEQAFLAHKKYWQMCIIWFFCWVAFFVLYIILVAVLMENASSFGGSSPFRF
jgi:hypothetical protein